MTNENITYNEFDAMTIDNMIQKVRKYLESASEDVQYKAVQTIKRLMNESHSPLWIYYAMTNNTIQDIERWGFNSIYSSVVVERINNKVEEHMLTQYSNPWDYLNNFVNENK